MIRQEKGNAAIAAFRESALSDAVEARSLQLARASLAESKVEFGSNITARFFPGPRKWCVLDETGTTADTLFCHQLFGPASYEECHAFAESIVSFREALTPTEQRAKTVRTALDDWIRDLSWAVEGRVNNRGPEGHKAELLETLNKFAAIPEVAAAVASLRSLGSSFNTTKKTLQVLNEPGQTMDVDWVDPKFAKQAKPLVTALTKQLRELRSTLEAQVKAEKGIFARQQKAEKEAAKKPVTPNASRSTHSGKCQFCDRLQKLPNGVIAKHGYEVRWREFQGACPGSGRRPYEETCDDVRNYIGSVLSSAKSAEAAAAGKEPGKERTALERKANELKAYAKYLQERVSNWKQGELKAHREGMRWQNDKPFVPGEDCPKCGVSMELGENGEGPECNRCLAKWSKKETRGGTAYPPHPQPDDLEGFRKANPGKSWRGAD